MKNLRTILAEEGLVKKSGESYMSVQALRSMRDHAEYLMSRVQMDTSLPDWVESKLARASQSLNDVYEYMSHGKGMVLASKTAKLKGERLYDALKKIVDEHQAAKIDGMLVDAFSASAVVQIADALKPANRRKYLDNGNIPWMVDIAFKLGR